MPEDNDSLDNNPTKQGEDVLSRFLPEGKTLGDLPTEFVEEQKSILFTSKHIIADRFEIVEELGFGGMGAVYKVKDLLMHDQIKALKIILPSLVRSDDARNRFTLEAEIAQSLRYEDGIVAVYDIGEDKKGDILFLTMELLEGKNLADYLQSKGGTLEFSEACHIVLKVCDALNYAHQRDVIHRDIKPHNIFILPDGRVKLLDFGLAKLVRPGRLAHASIGLGTPYYMSPEQSTGMEIDARADIFALGAVFYQMLIGRIPMGIFKLPGELNSEIPDTIDTIIEKCLSQDPEDRYKDVASLAEEIKPVKAELEKRIEEEKQVAIKKQQQIESLLKEGRFCLRQNDLDRAIENFELVSSIDVEHKEAKGLLSTARAEKKAEEIVRIRLEEVERMAKEEREKERCEIEEEESRNKLEEEKKKRVKETELSERENQKTKKPNSRGKMIIIKAVAICSIIGIVLVIILSISSSKQVRDIQQDMVFVKGGSYKMGDIFGDGYSDERPVHDVSVDGFYIGKYEVTQGQWLEVMGSNPSINEDGLNYPVEGVNWNDVQKFIKKLNEITGRSYRLPTEAEWEYAARSGGKEEKWSGTSTESELWKYAWYGSKINPIGSKMPNGLGIYDMSGNVSEWCQDWYDVEYYKSSPVQNPKGSSSGSYRVLRGGGWSDKLSFLRASKRFDENQDRRHDNIGFRLALSTPTQIEVNRRAVEAELKAVEIRKLALVAENDGKYEEALRLYKEAKSLVPGLADVDILIEGINQKVASKLEAESRAKNLLFQAKASEQSGKYEGALRLYNEAKSLDSDIADVDMLIENINQKIASKLEAESSAKDLIDKALVNRESGKYEEALRHYKEAKLLDSDIADIDILIAEVEEEIVRENKRQLKETKEKEENLRKLEEEKQREGGLSNFSKIKMIEKELDELREQYSIKREEISNLDMRKDKSVIEGLEAGRSEIVEKIKEAKARGDKLYDGLTVMEKNELEREGYRKNFKEPVVPQSKEKGTVTRSWLGISIQDLDRSLARQFGIKSTEGVLVGGVEEDSPAKKAGFEAGDIVVVYDRKKVRNISTLRNMAAQTEIGKEVKVKILRKGRKKTLKVTIGKRLNDSLSLTKPRQSTNRKGNLPSSSIKKYTKIPRVSFRTSNRLLSKNDVKFILQKHNIYDHQKNKNGNFQNDYRSEEIHENRVVIDLNTGLMWNQSGSDEKMTWKAAKYWVKRLNKRGYAGYKDWRLPTLEEAASLVEGKWGGANDRRSSGIRNRLNIDSVFDDRQRSIWTGDIVKGRNKVKGGHMVWVVFFAGGYVTEGYVVNNRYVRPVRTIR